MKLNTEPVKNWFGFTRRERRSSFILLLIIISIIALRYFVPEKSIDIKEYTSGISVEGSSSGNLTDGLTSVEKPLAFDPNTASLGTLNQAGFTVKEANTIINYRKKGGKFRQPADIKKIYGIDSGKADQIIPFVDIKTDTTKKNSSRASFRKYPLIDINSCDSATLVSLPGIGPVLSARIIKYRYRLGGFARINQLTEVYGLPLETYNIIKDRLLVDSLAVTMVNVNNADYRGLSRLPYFEKYEVTAILKFRELKGKVGSLTELIDNKIITKEKADKVRPYLKFEDNLNP